LNRGSLLVKISPARIAKEASPSQYAGTVLSSGPEIRQLGDIAVRLLQQADAAPSPEFFLASVSKGWRPKVVAVYNAGELVGIVYTKERIIAGIPTGIVYADGSLDSILVANPLHLRNVFRIAVEALLTSPRIVGVRLRLLPQSFELDAARQMSSTNVSQPTDARFFDIQYHDSPLWKYHAHLPLADTYDRFLKGLGAVTRRNFRYYRRRFETSGHQFVQNLSIGELRTAAHDLVPRSDFTARWQGTELETPLNMVAAASRPLAIGLRHKNGEWLALIGGWYRSGGAVLCVQLNNQRGYPNESLSLVLRGYLIESLILQGLQELVIWAETGPPLSRYVCYADTVGVRFDVPTYSWRATRLLVSAIRPLLPRRLAAAAQWIS
jgi:hypothetical protein